MASDLFPAPPTVDQLHAAEDETRAQWEQDRIFQRSVERPGKKGSFVFFEGPPTANNVPHIGHALTRAIKDVVPRFRTMQGYHVARKAGWDTHGLPVEIAIEKELGFEDKNAVEAYGIEPFNERCFQSVRRYEREWVAASERLGFWLDYEDAYFTFTNRYVESVWWILNRMFEEDMLYEGHKVLPYCPLCGTTHSSHEVAQAYKDVKDPSVTVGFRVLPGQQRSGTAFGTETYILAWTTTPWTLPSNMATCVHPEHRYKLVASPAHPERRYLLADGLEGPVEELVGKDAVDLRHAEALATFSGAELEGLQYQPLFDFSGRGTDASQERGDRPAEGGDWSVVVDPYVTLESGTGIVHVAPAFGEDDHRVGQKYGLTMYNALRLDGRFKQHAGPYAGMWFKDADPEILGDLKRRGHLVRSLKYEHPYPHCWRHGTPLYYFATSSWFVRTTAMKDRLIANNRQIRWRPEHIRDGRFGKWLEGVVDWALSRKRYWGTPLPIWRCTDEACGRTECFGSYASLFARAGRDLPEDPYDRDQWNPHRPFVDELTFACGACGAAMHRVTEVIDCWFDAGAMPFAQHHYPFEPEAAAKIDSGDAFPADFISEAVDQTRGWFYTLHVIATFLKDSPAFRSCVVLGHVLDEEGRKMSKRLGNTVEPGVMIDRFGADAFRWFFYRGNPTLPSRFGPNAVRESLKALLIPLLNAWSFFSIYADLDGFDPRTVPAPPFAERPTLDRWVLSLLQDTVAEVTEALEADDISTAAGRIEAFVESLTNWYIRRSRRRFWTEKGGSGEADKNAAYHTLLETLSTLAHLLAPFMPFLAERMHRDLVRTWQDGAADSVHLADWPEPDAARRDGSVLLRMDAARRVVTLGHSARQDAGAGVRQPLARATIVTVDPALVDALHDDETAAIVREELNVRAVEFAEDRAAYVTYQVKPNFRTLGKRLGARMKLCAQAVAALDPAATVALWESQGSLEVQAADGETFRLGEGDLDVRIQQREGTASAYDDLALVALDTVITEELAREGLAREVINRVQGLRKERDLAYDDRITLSWDGDEEVADALAAHAELVAGEVLAVELRRVPGLEAGFAGEVRGAALRLDLEVTAR